MSVHEAFIAIDFLNTTLSGDASLSSLAPGGVWRGVAPPNTPTPFVVFSNQSAVDVITANGLRLMTDQLFQVKAVGPIDQTEQISQAASAIDDLLKKTSGTAIGGYVLDCHRESILQLDEMIAGDLWTNIGGLYRLQAQQTS